MAENKWVFLELFHPTYSSYFTPVITGDRAHLVVWGWDCLLKTKVPKLETEPISFIAFEIEIRERSKLHPKHLCL